MATKAGKSSIPPVPSKYKLMGKGNFPPVWTPEKIGDFLEGIVQQVKAIPTKWKRKGKQDETRIMYVADDDGVLKSVWESAALSDLFDNAQAGDGVYIRYDGPIVIKGRKEPMKGYTTGLVSKGKKAK